MDDTMNGLHIVEIIDEGDDYPAMKLSFFDYLMLKTLHGTKKQVRKKAKQTDKE